MAAIFIVAGLAIADRVEKRKEAKRLKKERDEVRYRELQVETSARLARTRSGSVIDNTQLESAGVREKQRHEQGERHEEGEDSASASGEEDNNLRQAVDDAPPPAYEDAVAAGERREREWRMAQTARRRRSSVQSQQSGGRGAANYMRMG